MRRNIFSYFSFLSYRAQKIKTLFFSSHVIQWKLPEKTIDNYQLFFIQVFFLYKFCTFLFVLFYFFLCVVKYANALLDLVVNGKTKSWSQPFGARDNGFFVLVCSKKSITLCCRQNKLKKWEQKNWAFISQSWQTYNFTRDFAYNRRNIHSKEL